MFTHEHFKFIKHEIIIKFIKHEIINNLQTRFYVDFRILNISTNNNLSKAYTR